MSLRRPVGQRLVQRGVDHRLNAGIPVGGLAAESVGLSLLPLRRGKRGATRPTATVTRVAIREGGRRRRREGASGPTEPIGVWGSGAAPGIARGRGCRAKGGAGAFILLCLAAQSLFAQHDTHWADCSAGGYS
jgi:hypothetical protein